MTDGTPLADDAARLATLVRAAGPRGTVVFTGAGVSTESGIPDFRSPGGLWTQYAPITYQEYMRDPAMRRESWRRGTHTYEALAQAAPNPAHHTIAAWWSDGLLAGVVTQNIDGLHQRAGVPDEAVAELHGNSHRVVCLRCSETYARQDVQRRLAAGEEEPDCQRCGGMLKTATISFGQNLEPEVIRHAERLLRAARLCVVIGSSLVVYPAAALPELTLEHGGALAIVNATPTHLDPHASFVSRHPAGVLLGETARVMQT